MSGDHAGRGRSRPNTLRDQAVPNIVRGADVHTEPTRDTWQQPASTIRDEGLELEGVAARLYALARSFATRSQTVEARLLEDFKAEAAPIAAPGGDLVIRDIDAECISFRADGSFSGEVLLDEAPTSWRSLETALEIVSVCDPSDLFGDLADQLAAAYPSVDSPGAGNAGPRLRRLAELFLARSAATQDRAETTEVGLIERFEDAAGPLTQELGEIVFLDDADARLTLERDGRFLAQVIPEDDETSWRTLRTSEQVTEYYGPEELFRSLAEKLEGSFPAAADKHTEVAAEALYDLALLWQEQSLDTEARLFAEFGQIAARVVRTLGRFTIVDDDDEQLVLDVDGQLRSRVLDRLTGAWRELDGPDELVGSYDPADVFADLADALADAFPALPQAEPD